MQRLFSLALSMALPAALVAQATQAPTNDLPNPYKSVEGWAKLPGSRTWGSTSAVDIDKDGKTIWVAERCGVNSCGDSASVDPILHFDENGKLIKSFGAGMFVSPHGIFVDRDGNIWVTDCACTAGGGGRGRGGAAGAAPPPATKGHQVYKFSPDGKLLMTLGKAGGGRGEGEFFFQPNDVLVAPSGEIFVSQAHSGTSPARLFKFAKDGKLIATWGTNGTGPDEFDQPHALAMDSKGRLFVGDRGNNRIKILDQNGKTLEIWAQFGRPSGIFIDKSDNIYVADSESGSVAPDRADWKRGIRIGSARDGKIVALIPDPWPVCEQGQRPTAESPCSPSTSAAEGVAVDARGNIYGAEVGPKRLMKYEKKAQ